MKFLATFALFSCSAMLLADAPATRPYIDPAQLDLPSPKHSFYKQPWRAYLETRSADDFLHGIGINYNVPANDDVAIRLLAETGFAHARIEVGWGSVKWDESGVNDEPRVRHKLELCKQYHIRPILLLNAHHGAPCPIKFFEKRMKSDALAGARSVTLADVKDILPGHSGLNDPKTHAAAGLIITAVNIDTGECTLSKPLPVDMKAGAVSLATLKHMPFFPVGTKEFEDTSDGWTRYALLMAKLATDAGLEDFDLEFWNELSFGSQFVDANHYFDRTSAPADLPAKVPDFLNPGGSAWEMTHRAIDAVKAKYPKVRCIWGFSNTTFYHCAISKLPPATDGQSYHPYGTGVRRFPKEEDHPEWNLEGFTPQLETRMPEGWAHTYYKTECLIRLLNPKAREAHPALTEHFHHYMTEHGVAPPECGVTEDAASYDLKAKVALRALCFWLNKGVDVMDIYCAYDKEAKEMGLMPTNLPNLPVDAKFEEVATAPMKVIRNLTKSLAPTTALVATTPMTVEVSALGQPLKIFEGDAKHPPLLQQEVFAFLPFQATADRFVIPVYILTYDITKPLSDQPYRVLIKGLPATSHSVILYDPIQDKNIPVESAGQDGGLSVKLLVVDYPRLLVITK